MLALATAGASIGNWQLAVASFLIFQFQFQFNKQQEHKTWLRAPFTRPTIDGRARAATATPVAGGKWEAQYIIQLEVGRGMGVR